MQTDATCNIHIQQSQQCSELLANTCCIRLQGNLLRLTVLSLHSLPLVYISKKKKQGKESYIILLVWTDLKCPIELRVQSAPLTCAIDFAVYAIKYLMNISGVEESLGVDQTMLDQDLLWTKNIYIDLHQICSG